MASNVGTDNAGLNEAIGNLAANIVAGGLGFAVGGGSGAATAANADRFNRQLNDNEKKAIAEKAKGDKAEEKRLTDAACYRVQCWSEFSPNSQEYLVRYVSALDAKDLGPELKWVDSQTVPGGTFDYTLAQQAKDKALNELDQFKRGVQQFFERELPNLPSGFVNKMEADAKQKMSEPPAALVAQGVANGLNAVVGAGGVEPPPTSPGAVLVNSGARQAANASLSATANTPPNAIASSGNDDTSEGNRGTNEAAPGNQKASGGPYSNLEDSPSVGPGKKFTATQKSNIYQQNMEKNGGVLRSDLDGQELVMPSKSQAGVTPPTNEAQIDHVVARKPADPGVAPGTNSYSNAQVLSRQQNRDKSNK